MKNAIYSENQFVLVFVVIFRPVLCRRYFINMFFLHIFTPLLFLSRACPESCYTPF